MAPGPAFVVVDVNAGWRWTASGAARLPPVTTLAFLLAAAMLSTMPPIASRGGDDALPR